MNCVGLYWGVWDSVRKHWDSPIRKYSPSQRQGLGEMTLEGGAESTHVEALSMYVYIIYVYVCVFQPMFAVRWIQSWIALWKILLFLASELAE